MMMVVHPVVARAASASATDALPVQMSMVYLLWTAFVNVRVSHVFE